MTLQSENISLECLDTIQERINKNSDIVNTLVNKLVSEYSKPLDDYMIFVRELVTNEKQPPTDTELDDFTLNLPVLMYFTGTAQEKLGIEEDIAKMLKQELYNEALKNASGTVAQRTAAAELATQNEDLIHIVYQRAYKIIKSKMEIAQEMLNSIKKVSSRRMNEAFTNRQDSGRAKA